MHEKRIEIRWRDMDAFGHVNNAVYLTYLEENRDDWMQEMFEAKGEAIDYVVVRAEIDYRRELTQKDGAVIVRCRLDRLGSSSIHLREEIATLDGRLAAEARVVLVVRDPGTSRARPLTGAERATLERAAGRTGRRADG
ncbi:MAG: acyl-CoA thioesterase [Acidobacteriota bacterium]